MWILVTELKALEKMAVAHAACWALAYVAREGQTEL